MNNYSELIGYMASAGVLISFLFSDMKKLRIINTIGCLLFIAYGISLHFSWPVIITNMAIVGINAYHLLRKS
ncbi:MAG: uroporphyrinogen decarboxylase [Bacteroidia bacterium]